MSLALYPSRVRSSDLLDDNYFRACAYASLSCGSTKWKLCTKSSIVRVGIGNQIAYTPHRSGSGAKISWSGSSPTSQTNPALLPSGAITNASPLVHPAGSSNSVIDPRHQPSVHVSGITTNPWYIGLPAGLERSPGRLGSLDGASGSVVMRRPFMSSNG